MTARSKEKEPPVPAERGETLRQGLLDELRHGTLSTRELSARLGVRERDITPHLEHLQRSLRARGERLTVLPATCRGCDYVFEDRRALHKPSRCPKCRSERIEAPRFRVEREGEREGEREDDPDESAG